MSFEWKDYRNGGRKREMTLSGADFLRRFSRHLVPGASGGCAASGCWPAPSSGHRELPGAPRASIAENAPAPAVPGCARCASSRLRCLRLHRRPGDAARPPFRMPQPAGPQCLESCSLVPPDSG